MDEQSIVFSKIAATPTDTAWSQAYSAGKLFTVVALKKEAAEGEESALKAAGKSIIDSLETEFFTLEKKDLESVKAAIAEALKNVPEGAELSFVTSVISGNILYSYIVGKGKIFIKRGDQFGYVLESNEESQEISSASGFLQNSDLVILATDGFCQTVSKDQLTESIQTPVPSEIAENLAPAIHETEEAGAAAIILSFKEEAEAHAAVPMEDADEKEEPVKMEEKEEARKESEDAYETKDIASADAAIEAAIERTESRGNFLKNLPHSKKIYLTILVLIIVVIAGSIFLGIKKQNDDKLTAAFNAFYPSAEKKYEDGVSLKDLNTNLAMDDFNQAKKILEENKSKFPADSEQEKKITDLLGKVNGELAANPTPTSIDKSKITIGVQNGSGAEGAAGKVSDFLTGLGYTVSGTSNADNYNYSGITIKVKDSAKAYLDGLKSDLAKNYTISSATSDLSSGSPTDVIVIIGK